MRILYSFIIVVLFSCTKQLQLNGSVTQENFYEEIPFRYEDNLIVMEVKVEGNTYNMALDTGADYNVFDQSLEGIFDYNAKGKIPINSSTKKIRKIKQFLIPQISIGAIDFKNTAGLFINLEGINQFIGCPNIDGLIGNNLMRKANWKIDYKNQLIIISSDPSKLDYSKNAHEYDLNAPQIGALTVPMTISGTKHKLKIDTGYTGQFKSNQVELTKKYPFQTRTGVTGANAAGLITNQEYVVLIDTLSILDFDLIDSRLWVHKDNSSLIGNSFFDHFNMIINWEENQFILDPIKEFEKEKLNYFKYVITPNFTDNTLEINSTYAKELTNFKPGWKVIKIEEHPTDSFTHEELCYFTNYTLDKIYEKDTVRLSVINDEGKLQEIQNIRIGS